MKRTKYILFALISLSVIGGCSKFSDFGDTNVNPNATGSPITRALFTNVEAQLGATAAMTRPGLYAQYFSETQYTDVSIYSNPILNFSGEYSGAMNDLKNIINVNESVNQSAAAQILLQYLFWTITDRWGDVPYSEALQGKIAAKYDKQEDIYKGMISALTAAVAQFNNTSLIQGDVIYNGDVAKWKKLANSLRMMMAIQLSKRFPGASDYAATQFKAALNDPAGYIATNADNFTLTYPANFLNPWYNTYNGRKDFGESPVVINLLNGFGDARQSVYGTSNVGVPFGLLRAKAEAFTGANPTWSYILQPSYREIGDPVVILSAAQVTLARAEAADYGWTSEPLATVYQTGINLSFQEWGLPAPDASYFAKADVALTGAAGTGANFRQISLQRYIAAYPNGLQGWNIWRKSGYPVLTPAPDATNSSKQIPRRYTYGTGEYGSNREATEAAATSMGADTQDTRVWWDKQ
ncbi:MAG: hypothetical protein JWR18_1199 [Segetibacter sp.]|nr:hypothetical protein [Segetibacter sp.]